MKDYKCSIDIERGTGSSIKQFRDVEQQLYLYPGKFRIERNGDLYVFAPDLVIIGDMERRVALVGQEYLPTAPPMLEPIPRLFLGGQGCVHKGKANVGNSRCERYDTTIPNFRSFVPCGLFVDPSGIIVQEQYHWDPKQTDASRLAKKVTRLELNKGIPPSLFDRTVLASFERVYRMPKVDFHTLNNIAGDPHKGTEVIFNRTVDPFYILSTLNYTAKHISKDVAAASALVPVYLPKCLRISQTFAIPSRPGVIVTTLIDDIHRNGVVLEQHPLDGCPTLDYESTEPDLYRAFKSTGATHEYETVHRDLTSLGIHVELHGNGLEYTELEKMASYVLPVKEACVPDKLLMIYGRAYRMPTFAPTYIPKGYRIHAIRYANSLLASSIAGVTMIYGKGTNKIIVSESPSSNRRLAMQSIALAGHNVVSVERGDSIVRVAGTPEEDILRRVADSLEIICDGKAIDEE